MNAFEHHLNPAGETIALRPDHHLHIRRGAGWTVRATQGTVWLTQDGDPRDIVLQPGDSFVLDRDGDALLTALDDTAIRLCRKPARALQAGGSLLRKLFQVPVRATAALA